MDGDDVKIWGVLLLSVALVLSLAMWMYTVSTRSQLRWSQFKSDHHCTLVQQTDESLGASTSGNGIFIPGSETVRCEDGVLYTHSK